MVKAIEIVVIREVGPFAITIGGDNWGVKRVAGVTCIGLPEPLAMHAPDTAGASITKGELVEDEDGAVKEFTVIEGVEVVSAIEAVKPK